MSFILHEVTYFGRCIPWIIVDRVPYFRKYKLQDEKIPTPAEQWKCTKYVLMTHFTVELPQIWGFGPICEYFGMLTHHVPFPSWKAMTAQILLFFVFEDAFHYWCVRINQLLSDRDSFILHLQGAPGTTLGTIIQAYSQAAPLLLGVRRVVAP